MLPEIESMMERLRAPFRPDEIDWKPAATSKDGTRALAIAYVDARTVMRRLDEVFGLGGWQTTYRELPEGVVCRLRVKVGQEWIEHEDVGSFSEQPDGGDRLKAAFSDSLKRAAVHLSIARYLYDLPQEWVPYDKTKKCLVETPKLPGWALPKPPRATKPPARTPAAPAPAPETPAKPPPPTNGQELLDRLTHFEGRLIAGGLCQPGDLVTTVERKIRDSSAVWARNLPDSIADWPLETIEPAVTEARIFLAARKAQARPENTKT